jgi:NlpC/P60 family.
MCQINIDKYLLARYKHGGRTLPDVDCYGLVLEFFKNELKITLPLEQSITDVSQASEGEKNFKKIVKYAEITEINLERDKIYLCGFYAKNNFLAHCGIVINNKILHINKNGAVLQSIGTIKRIYSLWSLKFYEITYNSRT